MRMKPLFDAARNRLLENAELTAIVPKDRMTIGYNMKRDAAYDTLVVSAMRQGAEVGFDAQHLRLFVRSYAMDEADAARITDLAAVLLHRWVGSFSGVTVKKCLLVGGSSVPGFNPEINKWMNVVEFSVIAI